MRMVSCAKSSILADSGDVPNLVLAGWETRGVRPEGETRGEKTRGENQNQGRKPGASVAFLFNSAAETRRGNQGRP